MRGQRGCGRGCMAVAMAETVGGAAADVIVHCFTMVMLMLSYRLIEVFLFLFLTLLNNTNNCD